MPNQERQTPERFSHGEDGFWQDPEGLYVELSALQATQERVGELERFVKTVDFEVGCMEHYADEKTGMLARLAGEMAAPIRDALEALADDDDGSPGE